MCVARVGLRELHRWVMRFGVADPESRQPLLIRGCRVVDGMAVPPGTHPMLPKSEVPACLVVPQHANRNKTTSPKNAASNQSATPEPSTPAPNVITAVGGPNRVTISCPIRWAVRGTGGTSYLPATHATARKQIGSRVRACSVFGQWRCGVSGFDVRASRGRRRRRSRARSRGSSPTQPLWASALNRFRRSRFCGQTSSRFRQSSSLL